MFDRTIVMLPWMKKETLGRGHPRSDESSVDSRRGKVIDTLIQSRDTWRRRGRRDKCVETIGIG